MQTLPQNPVPVKAWYCSLDGLNGVITRPNNAVLFLRDTGEVHVLTDAEIVRLVVNGAVADAMAQYCADMAAGGYATIACSRANLDV